MAEHDRKHPLLRELITKYDEGAMYEAIAVCKMQGIPPTLDNVRRELARRFPGA